MAENQESTQQAEAGAQDTAQETSTLLTGEQQEEQAPDEGQKPEGEDAKEEKPKEDNAVPDTYEIKMQDGFTLAEGQQAELDAMFKDMGLTQAQAQKLADYYMSGMSKQQAQTLAAWQKQQEAEVAAARADAEIGGTALNESLGFAKAAMDKFGGEKFRAELEAHGMGNNAEMIRLLARVGRAMQGDTLVTGHKGGREKTAAEVLYPNLP